MREWYLLSCVPLITFREQTAKKSREWADGSDGWSSAMCHHSVFQLTGMSGGRGGWVWGRPGKTGGGVISDKSHSTLPLKGLANFLILP